ncbi:MAG: type VI secretion system tube protein Hcp [Sedimentisphaerales bacterium]|nr:type VI secretion system tube protein Hcp [Sedimentisphaerales bacterium]
MAVAGFIKIEGVKGESTDKDHKEWIEVRQFKHTVRMPGGSDVSASGGLAGGKADCGDILFTKFTDTSTPALCVKSFSADKIPQIIIHMCDKTDDKLHVFLTITLDRCIIAGYEQLAEQDSAFNRPIEEVALRFEAITWKYVDRSDTAYEQGYDRKQNVKTL